MKPPDTIYVAGGEGLVGAAIIRRLRAQGYLHVVGGAGSEPALTDAAALERFFVRIRPEYVFLTGGPSGGITANQRYPADLMRENLLMACHVIQQAHRHGVRKLLYLASSCAYPRLCPQPMQVGALLSGPLEPTSESYAVAKLAGIKLCQAYARQHGARFISAIPANPFGPGDDFDPETSHVIPGLIRRLDRAREERCPSVELWGTGTARREFLFVEDLADACLFVMQEYEDPEPINLGGGMECSIAELAALLRDLVGYTGRIHFDASRPDGMPRKRLDATPLRTLGWRPKTPFRAALAETYAWYREQVAAQEIVHAG